MATMDCIDTAVVAILILRMTIDAMVSTNRIRSAIRTGTEVVRFGTSRDAKASAM